MEEKTKEELWADWVATQNINRFQDLLKDETEEDRYRILEMLLADEIQKFKRPPLP